MRLKISNLSSLDREIYENLKSKSLKDLHAWLVLVPGGIRAEPYQFEKIESEKTHDKEMLELSLDFNETWKFKSKFFEKG